MAAAGALAARFAQGSGQRRSGDQRQLVERQRLGADRDQGGFDLLEGVFFRIEHNQDASVFDLGLKAGRTSFGTAEPIKAAVHPPTALPSAASKPAPAMGMPVGGEAMATSPASRPMLPPCNAPLVAAGIVSLLESA